MKERQGNGIAALLLCILILLTASLLVFLIDMYADATWRDYALWALGSVLVVYLLIEIWNLVYYISAKTNAANKKSRKIPSLLVLLSENASEVKSWDLRNRTGLVIGRSQDEADVDVDLTGSEYFTLISNQHAVLNYTANGWYLMDAGSQNGTSLLRKGSRQKLKLVPNEPIPIQPGDMVYLAEETLLAVK